MISDVVESVTKYLKFYKIINCETSKIVYYMIGFT